MQAARVQAITVFQGRAGDHNPRGMAGAAVLGQALATDLGLPLLSIGRPQAPLHESWERELEAARPGLLELAAAYAALLGSGHAPLAVLNRSVASLATLPQVARHRPEACILWFDAHADANVPGDTPTGYLGGLVLTGAAGLWESGLGRGLELGNVVLAGGRDFDPHERKLIEQGVLKLVPRGEGFGARLREVIGARPVYVHFDCDVLEPGIVPVEYAAKDGLTLAELHAVAEELAELELVGLEVVEFEAVWPQGGAPAETAPLCAALRPLLEVFRA